MNDHRQLPPDPQISSLLHEARPSPSLPPRFQQDVWRRIEHAQAAATRVSWVEALANWVLRPRFAAACLAVVLLAGTAAGSLQGWHAARHDAQMTYLASVMPHTAP